MNEINWAWVAGFYEGEGTIVVNNTKALFVSICQKDPEPLYMVQKKVGYGSVVGPYANRKSHLYFYQIGKQKLAFDFCRNVWPWLSIRRQEQIASCFDKFALVRGR